MVGIQDGGPVVIEGIASLILAAATFIAALGAFMTSLKNSRAVKEVHLSMNSRLDELVALTRAKAWGEGLAQGRIEGAATKDDGK